MARLLRPLRVHARCRVVVGEEPDQMGPFVQRLQSLSDLRQQAIGDILGKNNLAGGSSRVFARVCHFESDSVNSRP